MLSRPLPANLQPPSYAKLVLAVWASRPERWARGHAALDLQGRPVEPDDRAAVAWDLAGAARFVRGQVRRTALHWVPFLDWDARAAFERRLKELTPDIADAGMVRWNDAPGRTFDEVQAAVAKVATQP
jgi:hypothetical protein